MSIEPASLFGATDIDMLFKGAPKVALPWERVPRRKGVPVVDPSHVAEVLASPAHLVEIDPRVLWATQPWVLRHHVEYYTTGEWERTGRTSADRSSLANQYPLILRDERDRSVILAGHHRSAAALINGRPLVCRVLDARSVSLASPHDDAVAVVPHLLVGGVSTLVARTCGDAETAVTAMVEGTRVLVIDVATAGRVLESLGLEAGEISYRLRVAGLVDTATVSRAKDGWA